MTAPLRVLLVSHETTLSGAPIQLVHLARWLAEHNWAPFVIAPDDGPIADQLRMSAIPFAAEPELLTDPQHDALRSYSRKADVVVANTITAWQAVEAAHAENVPVVWYLHETLVGRRLIREIPQIRAALARAQRFVTPTRTTSFVYEALVRSPIDVVPYGIPAPTSRSPREPSATVNFVTLGTYERRKGQDVLLEAIERLRIPREAARFRMAGRNLDVAFYDRLAARAAELPNVDLLGPAEHEQSLELLAQADVLVLPSRDETMPIVLLEAMSLGKAIVATDVGGIRESLRDGLNGLLVPPDDPGALAAAIQRCLDDPGLVHELGAAARRSYEQHFTIERFGARFAEVLRGAMSTPPTTSAPQAWPDLYEKWVANYDTFTPSRRISLARKVRRLPHQPLISIVMPVYNPDIAVLQRAIDSVREQVYARWELCIADDASTDEQVRPLLNSLANTEPRIKLTFREKNGHIAACSNSALTLATGEWTALLDQDDALAPNAFAEIAAEFNAHPDAGVIYSDEDKIDLTGTRSSPFFKPDWNPELFLGQNFVNHLGAYRTALLHEIGGFREGFEGSQDYDLVLRCVERLRSEQIRHIPLVLYHWRAVAGSLADEVNAKPYAKLAARRAIAEHLTREGIAGRVEACPENPESHRVIYELPAPAPLVSVIIPTRNNAAVLKRCVDGLTSGTEYPAIELVIIDHANDEPAATEYLHELSQRADVRIVRVDGPFNFSRLNNAGVPQAQGTVLAFLNDDIEVTEPGWLREMVSHAVREEVGAVGARLWFPDGTLQHGGVVLGLGGVAGHAHLRIPGGHPGYFNRALLQQNCSAVTAACLVMRTSLFTEFDGFNEDSLGVNFNDVEFCLRLTAAGYRIVWTPYANLIHHESVSRGSRASAPQLNLFQREAAHMQTSWGAELLRDPFYSTNLRLELPDFYPSFPPRSSRAR